MITPRLNSILNQITGKTIADIGTDHGYIPIYLAQNNSITHAIACDIKPGPLNIAKKHIDKYNLSDTIEIRLGGGFEPIKNGEAEAVVVAGMGGEMIINILGENLLKSYSFNEIIVQPMNFQAELRKWLTEHNFEIICEDLSKEGFKIYNVLKIRHGKATEFEKEIDCHLPKALYKHELFPMLLEKKRREFTKILNGLCSAKTIDTELIKKYSDLKKELENICF